MDYGDGKKARKVPLGAECDHGTNYNDASAWRSFDAVLEECNRRMGLGIGFVFSTADSIVGVDLDYAYAEDGRLETWARAVVKQFDRSYCERTPSGRGLHIIGQSGAVIGRSRVEIEGGGIERYSQNRWFTFTGDVVTDGDLQDISEGMRWLAETFFGGAQELDTVASVRPQGDEIHDCELARVCLQHISVDRAYQGEDWRTVGYACKGTSESLKDDWVEWSSRWPSFNRPECLDRWARFDSRSSVGTLVHLATQDSGLSSLALREEARRRVAQTVQQVAVERPGDVTTTLVDAIRAWREQETNPVVKTGIESLDSLFGGGLPLGQMTAIAAAPGVGKSALALHLAMVCLVTDPAMTATWCLGEMTKSSLAARAITNFGSYDPNLSLQDVIQKKSPSEEIALDLEKNVGGRLKIIESPLLIDKIEAAVARDNPSLLIVDYLQLVRPSRAFHDKTSEINECLLRLREITTSRNIATLLVTNISKGCNENTEIGSIGKGSNQIDFDVDNFLFGYRTGETGSRGEVKLEWKCKKLRQGQMSDVQLWFYGRHQLFDDAGQPAVVAEDPAFASWSQF